MKKVSFILFALMIVIAFTFSVKVNADNPGQTSVPDSRQGPVLDNNTLCAPLTSINVSLTNSSPVSTACESCPTWHVSVWENHNGTPIKIGPDQAYSTSPNTYKWTGINWDQYDCIYLVWIHTPGSNCGLCDMNPELSTASYCPPSASPALNPFYEFYPPQ